MSENYDDDTVWETYVPKPGGMYSDGVWRIRNDEDFALGGWHVQREEPVYDPENATILYRRRKQAKPEPADDGAKFATRVIELVVCHQGAEVYDDSATVIRIEDESGGEFVTVKNVAPWRADVVAIERKEWPHIKAAIDRLIGECRE